jgi:hypothetical protein
MNEPKKSRTQQKRERRMQKRGLLGMKQLHKPMSPVLGKLMHDGIMENIKPKPYVPGTPSPLPVDADQQDWANTTTTECATCDKQHDSWPCCKSVPGQRMRTRHEEVTGGR